MAKNCARRKEMKAKKNVLFTFDYELFLCERSGRVQECLLSPTDEILRVLRALQTGEMCPVEWRPGKSTLGKV